MKITRVEAQHLRLSHVREIADGTQDCLVVRLHTDEGLTGLGEATSCSYVAKAVIEELTSADTSRSSRMPNCCSRRDFVCPPP